MKTHQVRLSMTFPHPGASEALPFTAWLRARGHDAFPAGWGADYVDGVNTMPLGKQTPDNTRALRTLMNLWKQYKATKTEEV